MGCCRVFGNKQKSTQKYHSVWLGDFAGSISLIDAECGRAKTSVIKDCIEATRHLGSFTYVTETVEQLVRVYEDLRGRGLNVTLISHNGITSTENDAPAFSSALGTAIGYLRTMKGPGHVLLLTWKTYSSLPKSLHRLERWKVFIDEVPKAFSVYSIDVNPKRYDEILDLITPSQWQPVNGMVRLEVKNRQTLVENLEQPDSFWKNEALRQFAADLRNQNLWTFMDATSWQQIQSGEVPAGGMARVDLATLLDLNILKGKYVAGAFIKQSCLYKLSKFFPVRFRTAIELERCLQPKPYCGDDFEFRYVLPNSKNSKHVRNEKRTINGRPPLDEVDDAVRADVAGDPCLHIANRDREVVLGKNFRAISPNCRGSNEFTDYSNIYISAAYNQRPKAKEIATRFGLAEACDFEMNGYAQYQQILRGVARVAGPKERTIVRVVGEKDARCLAKLFDCARVSRIGNVALENKFAPINKAGQKMRGLDARFTQLVLRADILSQANSADTDARCASQGYRESRGFPIENHKKDLHLAVNFWGVPLKSPICARCQLPSSRRSMRSPTRAISCPSHFRTTQPSPIRWTCS